MNLKKTEICTCIKFDNHGHIIIDIVPDCLNWTDYSVRLYSKCTNKEYYDTVVHPIGLKVKAYFFNFINACGRADAIYLCVEINEKCFEFRTKNLKKINKLLKIWRDVQDDLTEDEKQYDQFELTNLLA